MQADLGYSAARAISSTLPLQSPQSYPGSYNFLAEAKPFAGGTAANAYSNHLPASGPGK